MKRFAVSDLRVDCDNCLDHQRLVVVAYDDGEARLFTATDGTTPAVALRRIVKNHQRRGYECVVPVRSLDPTITIVEVECPTCHYKEDAIAVVDPATLDHFVAS